jgi:hypothetical protein
VFFTLYPFLFDFFFWLSLTEDWEEADRNQADDQFCHGHSEHRRRRCQRQTRQWDARQAIAEFSEFVKREDSSMLPAMEAIAAVGTSGAAAEVAGKNDSGLLPYALTFAPVGQVFPDG